MPDALDLRCDNCGRSNPTVKKRCVLDAPTTSGSFYKVVDVVWCDHCWVALIPFWGGIDID